MYLVSKLFRFFGMSKKILMIIFEYMILFLGVFVLGWDYFG